MIPEKNNVILKIFSSLALLIYIYCSMYFMLEGDGLTGCGVIFYIPCFSIIGIYYLLLIWRKGKVAGTQILLLPLLQKVNLFKTYVNTPKDKQALVKTVLPFLLSMGICPMLTSILYGNYYLNNEQNILLMIILLLPPSILVISFAKSFAQCWINQRGHL